MDCSSLLTNKKRKHSCIILKPYTIPAGEQSLFKQKMELFYIELIIVHISNYCESHGLEFQQNKVVV